MLRTIMLLLLVTCCTTAKGVGGEVGGTIAEWIACPTDLIDCGHVYLCEASADNELGHVEICVDDDANDGEAQLDAAEAMYGACELTPRHQGLCIWCPEKSGCNAYNGCFGCPPI